MAKTIGIRRENIDPTEARAPLTPEQVKMLIGETGCAVKVQPSESRIFPDNQFKEAGAEITDDLTGCHLVLGVKEVPLGDLAPEQPYVFFSHTIKAQPYNMPLLKKMLGLKDTLIDYELITGDDGKRLIFFGDYAGYVGMINSLWLYGQRMKRLGVDSPFAALKQTREYGSLVEAEEAVADVGKEIEKNGLPEAMTPLLTGFTGYGRVSKGAQYIYSLLPVQEIKPEELDDFYLRGDFSPNKVYKTEFGEQHLYQPKDAREEFDLQKFFAAPSRYKARLPEYLPPVNILIHGIYWDPRSPRLVTRKTLQRLHRLSVIGDITCDINGSIEATVKPTNSLNPAFVYEPYSGQATDGWEGEGVVVLAVDKLPSELPREASATFGKSLLQFLPALLKTDFSQPYEKLEMPSEFKKAVIAHKGKLTEDFLYLQHAIS